MVLPRLSSETGSACSVATVARMPLVQPRSCGEKQLLGRDLSLCFISPTSTETGSELRYRCPVPGCSYIGARANHAGDCLKHILDSRQMVDEHSRFLVDKLVCFQNADGKPALHSKPVVPSAFSFQLDKEPSSKALAYMKVGGVCCMCANQPIQACSCCPKGFCADHAVSEAHNAMHPISYGKCKMFICNFCQYNSDRIQASHAHAACLNQDCYPQELFTADGLWLSMYLKNPGPPLTVDDFCAQCYRRDLAAFEQKGVECTRWIKAGRNPGHIYWLQAGTTLRSRESVAFSGLHSLKQVVYYLPEQPAIAVLVLQKVTRELMLTCTGQEAISSLTKAMDQISDVRIVSFQAETNTFTYHGLWLITEIIITEDQKEGQDLNQAVVTMYNMPS